MATMYRSDGGKLTNLIKIYVKVSEIIPILFFMLLRFWKNLVTLH